MKKLLAIAALVALTLPSTASADRIDNAISLLKVPVFKVRAQACLALGAQAEHADRVIGPMTRALKDPETAVRAACAIGLGKLGAIEAAAGLASAMSDKDVRVSRMARKSLDTVLEAWVNNTKRFDNHRFNFRVAGLDADGRFKDLVISRLLKHQNVDVGVRANFDTRSRGPAPAMQLALKGTLKPIDGKRAHLEMALELDGGKYVLKSWTRVVAIGDTEDDTLSNAAGMAVGRILGYLGASR
ncbi:MAG: hypothetical protein ACI9WU_002359 [Myxococcota bacterium]|jgi:hypothetical protein